MTRLPLYTIGHSTRMWQEFVDLLREHQIRVLVDIRRFPGSRRYPHFNQGEMRAKLKEQQTSYVHLEALGGRREPIKDSKNIGWRNRAFRGYADHMASIEFKGGIDQLLELSQGSRAAIMCAEAVPWQCHRMLVSDYLAALCKLDVYHIISGKKGSRLQRHNMTGFAKVAGNDLEYLASDSTDSKEK